MERVVVVGSGASGVHFALTLLRRGLPVTMVDVGRPRPLQPLPGATLGELKEQLDDPVAYFLGRSYEGVLLPGDAGEYYGIPPSKGPVLTPLEGQRVNAHGFAPLASFAQGGLAEVWTGGCYPFGDVDLRDFPFGHADMAPHYAEVARRIGITGVQDDMARYLPWHDGLLPPLDMDEHTRLLLDAYGRKRRRLMRKGWLLGRARLSVLSGDRGHRKACAYLGRCLWGCPVGAFYTPSLTLEECRSHPGFTYLGGREARRFVAGDGGRIRALAVRRLDDGVEEEIPLDRLVLAAGTLGSTRLFLASLGQLGGQAPALDGLMDNRQVLMPFVNLRMIGRAFRETTYQYHQLALALDTPRPEDTVFGLVTTLKTALLHPIAQSLPFDLRTALRVTRAMHAALGLVNVNFPDTRRADCAVSLDEGPEPALVVRYRPAAGEPDRLRRAMGRVRRLLRTLGCVVPPGLSHVRPMGASVHYAGTLPMSAEARPWTVDARCRSRDFANLWLVDGSTMPFLPAKNITFTLMANAVRVAQSEF